jgi:hypothetical protein
MPDPAPPPAPAAPSPAPPPASVPSPSPPPPSPPPPAGAQLPTILGPDGKFVANWTELLPGELGSDRGLIAKYANPYDLAVGAVHAQKLTGRHIGAPTTTSSPEEIALWRHTVGAPETIDGYKPSEEMKKSWPEGMEWNDATAQPFLEIANKYHLPKAAMDELINAHIQTEVQRGGIMGQQTQAAIDQAYVEGQHQLQQEWGRDYEINRQKVARVVALGAGDPEDPGLASPGVVKMLARIAGYISEDRLVAPGGPGPLSGAQSYKALADDIVQNPQNPLYHGFWHGDRNTQEMVRGYYEQHSKVTNADRRY